MRSWTTRMDRAFDGGVLAFALWTICAHIAVALELGLNALLILAAAVMLAAAGLRLGIALRNATGSSLSPGAAATSARAAGATRQQPTPRWPRLVVASGATLCAAGLALDAPLALIWALAAASMAFAIARESTALDTEDAESASAAPAASFVLFGLAIACIAIALSAHRPDADDSFYLNLAVAAADAPDAPLLAADTLHRVPGVPLALPIYRVHSLELLEAALVRLTGRSALDVAHLWLPALTAIFVPFVVARSMRRLTPRAWLWATSLALGVLLFTASATNGWANFGLLRLHQGKGILLTLALPAVIAYALEHARSGGVGSWLRLAAAQICAVGVSASGLWLAPLLAGPALLAGTPNLRSASARRRIAGGLAASVYVVGVALVVHADTVAAFRDAAVPSPEKVLGSLKLATQALHVVFGPGPAGSFVIFVAIGAWSFARTAAARRLCIFTAALCLLLWNPFFAAWIAAHLTSAAAYWRVLWLLPMPLLVGVVLASPIEFASAERATPRVAVALVAAIVFGTFALLTPRAFAISAANHVRLAIPGWKVPPNDFDAARAIVAAASRNDRVLAPRLVAPWIPTFRDYPIPLIVRSEYLPVLYDRLGGEELARRMILLRLVSGQRRGAQAVAILRSSIVDDGLAVVCLARSTGRWPDVVAVLRETGFQKIHGNADYEVWKRATRTRPEADKTSLP